MLAEKDSEPHKPYGLEESTQQTFPKNFFKIYNNRHFLTTGCSTSPSLKMSQLRDSVSCAESSQDSSLLETSEGSDGEAPSSPDPNSLISYSKAASYWDGVPASVNGMLGGLGQVSSIDIRSSDQLLTDIWKVSYKWNGEIMFL